MARGERENALQCKYNGGVVPLGFTIGKEDRLYHIDPETAPIVQEIFSRYANGEPAEKIAASLNERGLRTRTGKPFVKNSFFQIFRNRRYIGEYRYKDIVTPGGIPAVSYTHLDVYKRQAQSCRWLYINLCLTPSVTAAAVPAPPEEEPLAVRESFRFCQGLPP